MANQIIENARGDQRHGSCGIGIWETMRNRYAPRITCSSDDFFRNISASLSETKDYYLDERLPEKTETIPIEWIRLWSNENLLRHYIEDCKFFYDHVSICSKSVIDSYDVAIFENGQGLLLDQDLYEGNQRKYTTPSNTGLKIPSEMLKTLGRTECDELEVCYVTRTYLTRHGNGLFDDVEKLRLKRTLVDATNTFNIWQGEFRIGAIDYPEMIRRTLADFCMYGSDMKVSTKLSYAITHCDELPPLDVEYPSSTKRRYQSFGSTRLSVHKFEMN